MRGGDGLSETDARQNGGNVVYASGMFMLLMDAWISAVRVCVI